MSSKRHDAQHLIQLAREANTGALTLLTNFMLSRPVEKAATWKEQGVEVGGVRFWAWKDRDKLKETIWFPLVTAICEFSKHVMDDSEILWISAALEESPEVSHKALGLKNTVVLHRANSVKNFEFQFTFTRHFVEQRHILRAGSPKNPGGIGLCATKMPLRLTGTPPEELHFLHVQDGKFASHGQSSDDYHACIQQVNAEIKTKDKWAEYIAAYQPLIPAGKRIAAHISATSFYNPAESQADTLQASDELRNQAVAQLVVGFSKAPRDANAAVLFYQLLQILLSGIPPLYSSLSRMTRQIRRLQAHQDRMRLVEEPLVRVSRALAEMQSEVQELRAVLYDPARALFQSHRELSELFTERGSARLAAHVPPIELKHELAKYDNDPTIVIGRAVLAAALCRIFGRSTDLNAATDVREIVDLAKVALVRVEKQDANGPFRALCENIRWLCGARPGVPLAKILDTPSPGSALERIKKALFDPYKVDSNRWPILPFTLAGRCFADEDTRLNAPRDNVEIDVTAFSNPTTCHHVVELFMGVAAATKEPNSVTAIRLSQGDALRLSFAFNTRIISDPAGAEQLADHIFEYVLKAPRDWRVEHQLAGNWRKPFVDFASRLLGVTTKWVPIREIGVEGRFSFIALQHVEHGAMFRVFVEQPKQGRQSLLIVEWSNASAPARPTKIEKAAKPELKEERTAHLHAFLLDHHHSEPGQLWKAALTETRLIPHDNSHHEMTPDEFLADQNRQIAHAVFLHARQSKTRKRWNRAVVENHYAGYLIHVSVGEPRDLTSYGVEHPRIHICEYGPKDFYDGRLAAFIESCRNPVPDWRLLRRSTPAIAANEILGPRKWSVDGAPSVVVVGSDYSLTAEINGPRFGVITDKELQHQAVSPTCHANRVKVVVLAHADGESEAALLRRYNVTRRWLQSATEKKEVHSVVCLIWTPHPDAVRRIVLADDGKVRWTFGKLEKDKLGVQVLDSMGGGKRLMQVANDPKRLAAACDLKTQDQAFASDVLKNALAHLVKSAKKGGVPAFTAAQSVAALLSDSSCHYRLADCCIGATSIERHNSAAEFLAKLPRVTSVVTPREMRVLVSFLSLTSLPM